MILKFDDVIYRQNFDIEMKDDVFSIVVEVTDVESEQIGKALDGLLKGDTKDDDLLKLLFKDDLPKLKKILIGANFNRFVFAVLGDFRNFTVASLQEAISTTTPQQVKEI